MLNVICTVRLLKTVLYIFDILFLYATQHQLNLVIDEVQEFFYIRKSIFADMQELWGQLSSYVWKKTRL